MDSYRIVTCGHALLKTATPQGSSPGGGHSVALPETRPLAHQMHAPEFWQRLLWGVRQGGKCWPTKTLVPLAKERVYTIPYEVLVDRAKPRGSPSFSEYSG